MRASVVRGSFESRPFLEANKKCGTQSDLGSAACRLPAEAGVGTVAEMVVEGVEYVIRLALLKISLSKHKNGKQTTGPK